MHGKWDKKFDKVAEALADEITKGEELGASIAVDIDGELVVDIWGGHADRAKTVPWAEDTIVNFWSCTKTLTALAGVDARSTADCSILSRPSPSTGRSSPRTASRTSRCVTSWPTHRGCPDGRCRSAIEDVYDWEKSTSHLARQAPWWPPGTASGYHAINLRPSDRRGAPADHRQDAQRIRPRARSPARSGPTSRSAPVADDHDRIAELIPPPPLRSAVRHAARGPPHAARRSRTFRPRPGCCCYR